MNYNKNMFIAYVDGAARGNPGPSGIGIAILTEKKETIKEISRYVGIGTNNQAEYLALLEALEAIKQLGAHAVTIYSDSQLVVRQINGQYEVKDKKLKVLHESAKKTIKEFEQFQITHIPREENKRADKLANLALDEILLSKSDIITDKEDSKTTPLLEDGEKLSITIPNKSSIRPFLMDLINLLSKSFHIEDTEINNLLNTLNSTNSMNAVSRANSTNPYLVENLQIVVEDQNNRIKIWIKR